jgi:hypothetical protein
MSTLRLTKGFPVVSLLTAVVLVALGAAGAIGQDKSEKPVRGGHLIVAASKSMDTPHPFIGVRSVSEYIKMAMFQSLVAYDDKGPAGGATGIQPRWSSTSIGRGTHHSS